MVLKHRYMLHLNFGNSRVKLRKRLEKRNQTTAHRPIANDQVEKMPHISANFLKWFFVFVLFWIAAIGCDKQDRNPAVVSRMPDSFHFMDIGVNTIIDSDVRNRLVNTFGSDAIDRKSTIDLDLKYKGFLKAYYPDLAVLNQKLNVNDMVRKEYPATRLTFRNTGQTGSLFNLVELIYANDSGCPLLIKMAAKKEISDLIDTIKKKYGPPAEIPIEEGRGFSLSWKKQGDAFVIARFPGNYNQPEYHLMIVYANRLVQLMTQEAEAEKQRKGKGAEKVF